MGSRSTRKPMFGISKKRNHARKPAHSPFSVYLLLFSGPDFHQLSKYVATATRTCTTNAVFSSLFDLPTRFYLLIQYQCLLMPWPCSISASKHRQKARYIPRHLSGPRSHCIRVCFPESGGTPDPSDKSGSRDQCLALQPTQTPE